MIGPRDVRLFPAAQGDLRRAAWRRAARGVPIRWLDL